MGYDVYGSGRASAMLATGELCLRVSHPTPVPYYPQGVVPKEPMLGGERTMMVAILCPTRQ